MKVSVISFGKVKNANYDSQIQAFYEQISKKSKGIKFKRVIKTDRNSNQKQKPVEVIDANKLKASQTYVLAEWGQELSTAEFINLLVKKQNSSQDMNFLCGNAFGWEKFDFTKQQSQEQRIQSRQIRKSQKIQTISLSKMTYNHELAQVMLFEQLYRFVDHINGGNYAK